MDCSRCRELMIHKLKGRLNLKESNEFELHMQACHNCKNEYLDTNLLFTGFRSSADIIESGHISSRLLYEYFIEPHKLEKFTYSNIKKHLAKCPACMVDLQLIKELSGIHIPNKPLHAIPFTSKVRSLVFPTSIKARPSFSAAASLIVTLIILYSLYIVIGKRPTHVVRIIQPQYITFSDYDLYTLPSYSIDRGEPGDILMPFEISLSRAKMFILKINIAVIYEVGLKYRVIMLSSGGKIIWENDVEARSIRSGSILLLFNSENISPNRYEIQIVEYSDAGYWSVVSSSKIRFKL